MIGWMGLTSGVVPSVTTVLNRMAIKSVANSLAVWIRLQQVRAQTQDMDVRMTVFPEKLTGQFGSAEVSSQWRPPNHVYISGIDKIGFTSRGTSQYAGTVFVKRQHVTAKVVVSVGTGVVTVP